MLVQLYLTPETEVLYLMFDRFLSLFNIPSLKRHIEHFNFRCRIHLDHPVQQYEKACVSNSTDMQGQ